MTREPPEVLQTFGLLFPTAGSLSPLVLSESGARTAERSRGTALVGDPDSTPDDGGWSGNAVSFSWDVDARELRVRTSVAGFPPAFVVRLDGWWGVVSSVARIGSGVT